MSEQINETYFAWLNKRIDKYEPPSREEVWNAATAEANKRIDALEGEVAELKQERNDLNYLCMERLHKIEELQANNNDLREALVICKQFITEAIIDDKYHEASCGLDEIYNLRDKAIKLSEAAISATPAESLQAFENEVIEKCAKAIDEMVTVYTNNCDKYKAIGDKESTERNVNKGRAAISCAEVIRALKGK